MDPAITAAIIGAAGSAASAATSAAGSFRSLKKAKKFARFNNQLAREQAAWNNYYGPTIQMEGYKAAGLNPFIAAGGSSPASAGSSSASISSVPDYAGQYQQSISFGLSALNSILSAMNQSKDLEKKDADIANVESQTENIRQQTLSELWRYQNLFPLNKTMAQKEIGNIIERNFLLSLQSQGQAIRNEMDKYNLDFILPIERETKYWGSKHAQYQYEFLDPASRALMSAQAFNQRQSGFLARQRTATERFNTGIAGTNLKYLAPYLSSRNEKANADFVNQVISNAIYDTFGTREPGNLKFAGIPFGVMSSGLNKILFNRKHKFQWYYE